MERLREVISSGAGILIGTALALLFSSHLMGQFVIDPYRFATSGSVYLLEENFEGIGLPGSFLEVGSPSTRNYDYNGANVLEGTESLDLDNTTSSSYGITHVMSAASTVYFYGIMRFTDQTPSSTARSVGFYGDAILTGSYNDTDSDAGLYVGSGGQAFLMANGGLSSASATTLSANTVYHVWITFDSGGTCELAISTSTTKPSVDGGGNVYLTKTGAVTGAIRCAVLGQNFLDYYIDKIRISLSPIGDSPL